MRTPFTRIVCAMSVVMGLALPTLAQETPAALYLWTDKYVYLPNEPIVVRWSVQQNGDTTPYSLVIYRQNNQNGEKAYFPGNTSQATDVSGRTPTQGFQSFTLGDASKSVVIGPGGWLSSELRAPNDLGMHTVVIQLRDATGTRVVKSAYFKFSVVDGFDDLRGNIDADRTLVNTRAYRLSGLVFVRATLTIQPGTIILGQPGSQPPSVLLVTQRGRLLAEGTRSRPIIMTSAQPFGQRRPGDWGGLILLGRGPVNWPTGFGNIEGLPASDDTRYGGSDPDHSCGRLAYVRVEYAGAEFQPNEEVNAFTFGGCGRGTVAHHLESKYGLDDAFEWFGGNMDAKYLVALASRDDYVDGQIGWTGRLQYVLAVAGVDVPGNRGIEMDNNQNDFAAAPRSNPTMYNMTFVGVGDTQTQGSDEGVDVSGIWLRRGSGGAYNNSVIYNWIANGFVIRDNATMADAVDRGELTADGLLMFDNGKASGRANDVAGQTAGTGNLALPFIQGTRGRASNVSVADPLFRRPFVFSDPDFRPRPGSPIFNASWVQPPDDGFFDQWAHWIGAFGAEDWTEEWTSFHAEDDVKP